MPTKAACLGSPLHEHHPVLLRGQPLPIQTDLLLVGACLLLVCLNPLERSLRLAAKVLQQRRNQARVFVYASRGGLVPYPTVRELLHTSSEQD